MLQTKSRDTTLYFLFVFISFDFRFPASRALADAKNLFSVFSPFTSDLNKVFNRKVEGFAINGARLDSFNDEFIVIVRLRSHRPISNHIKWLNKPRGYTQPSTNNPSSHQVPNETRRSGTTLRSVRQSCFLFGRFYENVTS